MTVSRVPVRCHVCTNRIVLRITIDGGFQPFLFACPYCRTEMHASLFAQVGEPSDLRSEDFDVLDTREEKNDLAVAINTDLPVHLSFVGQRAADTTITPFIDLCKTLGTERVGNLMPRIDSLRGSRKHLFPHLRRAASYFAQRDLAGLQIALRGAPGGDHLDFLKVDPVEILGLAFNAMYEPFEDQYLRRRAAEEFIETLAESRRANSSVLTNIYAEFQEPFAKHRARVIDTALTALDNINAIFPALWAESMEGHVDFGDYRVMRDDFHILKSRYQDLFELASRTLAFTARVANLAHRGDPCHHVDGTTRSLNRALNRTPARDRTAWLVDFPAASKLYDAIKRHTRNDRSSTSTI